MSGLEEHILKMENIKKQADNSKGIQRLQLMKCYHRMQKELLECNMYLEKKVIG
jgi:hypothetical protein